jgi:hypothetical protein
VINPERKDQLLLSYVTLRFQLIFSGGFIDKKSVCQVCCFENENTSFLMFLNGYTNLYKQLKIANKEQH